MGPDSKSVEEVVADSGAVADVLPFGVPETIDGLYPVDVNESEMYAIKPDAKM
jgi:hypothetical protein